MKVLKCISILIFGAFVDVTISQFEFCENGEINELQCPDGFLITGMQTTSELFSADATPVCSELGSEIVRMNRRMYIFRKDDEEPMQRFTDPKVFCNSDHTMRNLKLCTVDGVVTETYSLCDRLLYVEDNNATYTVVGEPNSPVLKCEEGSVFHGIQYNRDEDGNLIAVATCTAMDVGKDRVSILEKREKCIDGELVEVACPDGYIISGFESSSKIFTPEVTPLCTKISDKINLENPKTYQEYFFKNEYFKYSTYVVAMCYGDDQVLAKFSYCVQDGLYTATAAECYRFQDNVKEADGDSEYIRQPFDSSPLKCSEGSFLGRVSAFMPYDVGSEEEIDNDRYSVAALCIATEE